MHKILLISVFTVTAFFSGLQPAISQIIAPQPCDPQFYKQMSQRAWLESEREIMQNQNLIFKADSILEYTCFDQFANITAWEGGNIFTHTPYFGGAPLIERGAPYGLEVILQEIIFKSLNIYRFHNFNHSLLGGRGHHVGLDNSLPYAVNGVKLFTSVAGGAENQGTKLYPITTDNPIFVCPVMAEVWKKAKCMNFVHNDEFKDKDSFYPFEPIKCYDGQAKCTDVEGYTDLEDQDVRKYPANMACDTESGILTWEAAAENAENRGNILYDFQEPLGKIFKDVFDKTFPGLCGKPGIKTGVKVVLPGEVAHDDGVCTNPGCTYTAGGTCAGGGTTGSSGLPAET